MSLELPSLHRKTYPQILKDLVEWIPNYSHDWNSRNPSDPAMVILELFSWLGDTTYYQINRLPVDAYINFLRLITGVYDSTGIDSEIFSFKVSANLPYDRNDESMDSLIFFSILLSIIF